MKVVATPAAPAAIGPYSQAIIANGILYTSGQIPLRADGSLCTGSVEEQTHQVFQNLEAVLKEANCHWNNVIKVTVFLSDMNNFQRVNEIYAHYFSEHKPSRSCVEVARLPKDVAIEIELIASVIK